MHRIKDIHFRKSNTVNSNSMNSGFYTHAAFRKMKFISRHSTTLLIIVLVWLYLPVKGQNAIRVVIPTVEEESEYIWQNICSIGFFDQHGYRVAWPEHPLIAEFLDEARDQRLNDSSYNVLTNIMRHSVYREADYLQGYDKVKAVLPLLDSALEVMHKLSAGWGYESHPDYTILLTLYGPGGSYDDSSRLITLFTTADGNFKGYNNPGNTLIHELFHIMIEKQVVQKYNLTHQQKERLVDLFIKTWFGAKLPDYRIQGFGDSRMDEWFNTREKFVDLPASMKGFLDSIRTSKN